MKCRSCKASLNYDQVKSALSVLVLGIVPPPSCNSKLRKWPPVSLHRQLPSESCNVSISISNSNAYNILMCLVAFIRHRLWCTNCSCRVLWHKGPDLTFSLSLKAKTYKLRFWFHTATGDYSVVPAPGSASDGRSSSRGSRNPFLFTACIENLVFSSLSIESSLISCYLTSPSHLRLSRRLRLCLSDFEACNLFGTNQGLCHMDLQNGWSCTCAKRLDQSSWWQL
jgi:hypothetical protein